MAFTGTDDVLRDRLERRGAVWGSCRTVEETEPTNGSSAAAEAGGSTRSREGVPHAAPVPSQGEEPVTDGPKRQIVLETPLPANPRTNGESFERSKEAPGRLGDRGRIPLLKPVRVDLESLIQRRLG